MDIPIIEDGELVGVSLNTDEGLLVTSGEYYFDSVKSTLVVILERVNDYDVITDDVLGFLFKKKVISDPALWRVSSVKDSSGFTNSTDLFATVTFKRVLVV